MFDFWIPAASTAAAYVALLRCGAVTACVYNRGPMRPGIAGLAVVLRIT